MAFNVAEIVWYLACRHRRPLSEVARKGTRRHLHAWTRTRTEPSRASLAVAHCEDFVSAPERGVSSRSRGPARAGGDQKHGQRRSGRARDQQREPAVSAPGEARPDAGHQHPESRGALEDALCAGLTLPRHQA